MQRSQCVNINNVSFRRSVLKPVVPPPVPRSPSDSSALPAASCGVAQAALFPPGGGGGVAQAALFPPGGGSGGGVAQAALFPPGGSGGGVAQAALLPPCGGGDGTSHILNGRLARHAGPPPLPLAAALPPPLAAASAPGVVNCDIALQYQRLFEEQRDLSPLTQQLNNHCATSATAAAPAAVAPPSTAKCPPSSPGQQQRRLSAPNNGPQAVGGNRRAATLASRRRSSAAVQRKAGRSPESSPLSTYPPPPSDYGLPVTQSFPVPACSPSPESLAHRCRAGPELYLRNGETYIGPDYSTTTLPHRVSAFERNNVLKRYRSERQQK
jgi:hypothetical protein